MCLGADSASPLLDDDFEGSLASLESVLNQPTSIKRPHSPSSTCQCPCAALHRAAAAKSRKCCGGNCSCPPGACKCVHSAITTQCRCCPVLTESDAENDTAASSLGDAGCIDVAVQSGREESDCLSSIQPHALSSMLGMVWEAREPVGEFMSAQGGQLRTAALGREGGNAHARNEDEDAVGAFDSNSLAALVAAAVEEPDMKTAQLDENDAGNVGEGVSVLTGLNLSTYNTGEHLTEGTHASTAYAGALLGALQVQSTLPYSTSLPLEMRVISHRSSYVNNGIEGTCSRSMSTSQIPQVNGVIHSRGLRTFPTSSPAQRVSGDLNRKITQPLEDHAKEQPQEVIQEPNCQDVGSSETPLTVVVMQRARCGSGDAPGDQRGASAEKRRWEREKENKRVRTGMLHMKREDEVTMGGSNNEGRKLIDNGDGVAKATNKRVERDALSKPRGKTSTSKEATTSGQGGGLARVVARKSLTDLRAEDQGGGLGQGERRSSLTCPGTESRDRTFACNLCTSTFFFKQNRDRHINEVHLGKRPHKCEYPDCEGAFKNRSGLKQHVRTVHEKARPFECEQCDSAFGQRNHLTQHVLVVHNKLKLYDCGFCGVAFSNVGNRTQHIRRRHSDPQNSKLRAQLPESLSYDE